MLMLNYGITSSISGRKIGGGGIVPPTTRFRNEVLMNRYTQDVSNRTQLKVQSFPTGTEPPYSYGLPLKGGELSSTTYISGRGVVTSSLVLGRVMEANLSGSCALTSSMSLITSLSSNISGSGIISGELRLALSLAASLVGSGNVSGSLSLLIPLEAHISSIGTISANLKGNADLSAHIYVNQAEATAQQLVAAMWNANASDYNTSGTMGQKLNGAGSAGDPWTTDLSAYTTAGTAGALMKKASKPKISL